MKIVIIVPDSTNEAIANATDLDVLCNTAELLGHTVTILTLKPKETLWTCEGYNLTEFNMDKSQQAYTIPDNWEYDA